MITNPEDTGIFNPHIGEFVRRVHERGGLAAYDLGKSMKRPTAFACSTTIGTKVWWGSWPAASANASIVP